MDEKEFAKKIQELEVRVISLIEVNFDIAFRAPNENYRPNLEKDVKKLCIERDASVQSIMMFCRGPSAFSAGDALFYLRQFLASIKSMTESYGYFEHKPQVDIIKSDIEASISSIILLNDHTDDIGSELVDRLDKPNLPEVRPAPILAVVKNDILSLTYEQHRTGAIDYPAANRVLEVVRDILGDAINELKSNSNADRGYIKICERLLFCMSSPIEDISIEEFGVRSKLVERSTRRLTKELGEIVTDQIDHVLSNIFVLLSQFAEWQRFLDEQAKTKLDPDDADGLVALGSALITELEKPDAPVEPELIERLRGMVEPTLMGIVGADTVAIPLVCSLSNIFSALSKHAIDYHESLGQGKHVFVAGTIAIFAKFSIDLIQQFCPLLSKYQPLAFIISVVKYISSMYSQGKDATV